MKKIMILTADKTGNGHKSAANAIEKRLNKLGYNTKQIDCFKLMGKTGNILENSYIPLTIKCPTIFYITYKFAQTFPDIIHFMVYLKIKRKLNKEIKDYNPNLIISVHSMFTKAVSHLIKKENLNIPFYIDVIDLINPPKVWFDKFASTIFVPTKEVKEDYEKKGINNNKLILSGFPIRDDIHKRTTPKKVEDKVNILLVNPSVNLRKNIKYVKEVSKLANTSVTVICGRDKKMYKKLIKLQNSGKISKDIMIYSFVKNMNEYLDNSHILLAKAGPNMILEGARSGTAIVITGHIKGQENNNYEYVVKNDFGFKCEDPNKIYSQLNEFIVSKKVNKCLENLIQSDCSNGTEIISNYIKEQINV